jgi:hypothetical protein
MRWIHVISHCDRRPVECRGALADEADPLGHVEEWASVDEEARGTGRVNVVGRRSVERTV